MRVLGIETSCDETGAAVVDEAGRVLSDVVRTQISLHAPYGGVVPEIAARDHIRACTLVVQEALTRAETRLESIDAVAVTNRPGLVGALLVGLQTAKGLAWAANKPLVGVDHLVGHLMSVFLQRGNEPVAVPRYPFVGLLVSGGHTALYRSESHASIRELGATRDDAVGEAFDKIAKLLGLGYPGGPVIDRRAARGDPERVDLPAPMAHRDSLEFSFSGLKSAVARRVKESPPRDDREIDDLCAAFQAVATQTLVDKTLRAARNERVSTVVVAGGVAANQELRARMKRACDAHGLALHVPPFASCTDNAAMIAYAGALRRIDGAEDGLDLAPATFTVLPRRTRKGAGPRAEGR
jgi:N6-L-threonylcarbamoyladenine synthase